MMSNLALVDKMRVHDILTEALDPIELEIGSGRGTLLCELARSLPSRKFIGVDINREVHEFSMKLLARKKLTNIVFVHAEAREFLSDRVPSNRIDSLHIYFPTPPAMAPEQRRIILDRDFALQAHRVLRPGGDIRLLTDREECLQRVHRSFVPCDFWVREWAELPLSLPPGYLANTEWERKTRPTSRIYCCYLTK